MLVIVTGFAFGQKSLNKDTVKKQQVKPQYEYFVRVPANIYYQLVNTAHSYRDVLIYDPNANADNKLNSQAAIDKAIVQLRALPVDSVVINTKQQADILRAQKLLKSENINKKQ